MYGETIPARNLHLIMGTMLTHPRTFIIFGMLRSWLDPAELARQASLLWLPLPPAAPGHIGPQR